MIRLGHIDYSNCIPVHALLLERGAPGIELVADIPSQLNAALAAGRIDAAPCSSIEYARHADEYRILPAHAIGADGPVQSILLESAVAPAQLDGCDVAIPTASATSVVLLKILLQLRYGVQPRYHWFEQRAADPLADGAAAALRIGDVALTRVAPHGRQVRDLAAEWREWTGLPFAFAVWQVRRALPPRDVQRLVQLLSASRAAWAADPAAHAERHAARFGLTPARLLDYWSSLRFDLDERMQRGLLHFYRLAAELGEAPRTDALDIVPVVQE